MASGESLLETLYILDLDRTLVDSSRLSNLFLSSVETFGIDTYELRQREARSRGQSFNLIAELMLLVEQTRPTDGRSVVDDITAHFLQHASELRETGYRRGGFFEPGARQLLHALPRETRMIFTYGTDQRWQTVKLQAAGLINEHHMIATGRDKFGRPVLKSAVLKHSYNQQQRRFVFTDVANRHHSLEAKHVVMVDDKLENLVGLPALARGIWYVPARHKSRNDDVAGRVPEQVRLVYGHRALVHLLKVF